MVTISSQLPIEIEAAVAAQHGGPVTVSGSQTEHVVMSMAIFRDLMGVGSDEEFEKSIADLRLSLAQAAAGESISLEQAREKLAGKYGV